jgi:hypothetical integral membrane protein (TIGR02206 family)
MATYLVPLAVTAAMSVLAVLLPWKWDALPWGMVGGVLGGVLLIAELSWWAVLATRESWTPATDLPLELCDVTAVVGAIALWWRRPLLVELLWFWGIGGGVLALLSPELPEAFPSWLFFQYYVVHGGIVVAPLLLSVGLRAWPRPAAVRWVAPVTLGYALCRGVVNILTGGNYLWLRHPPTTANLLDLLGPWPWYLLSMAIVGFLMLLLLQAPFAIARRRVSSIHEGTDSRRGMP